MCVPARLGWEGFVLLRFWCWSGSVGVFAWPKSSSSVDVLFGLVEFVVHHAVSVSIPSLPRGDDKDLSQIVCE